MPSPTIPEARSETLWFDGDFIPWDQARVHVLSHALHYGTSVFEGIRCYATANGPAISRLEEHVRRFLHSAKIIRMPLPYTLDELGRACSEAVAVNEMGECYIRPIAFRGAGEMGVLPKNCPTHVAIGVWPWGAYLGEEGLKQGIDTMVSTWTKVAPNTIPAQAKIGGAYVMATVAKIEAVEAGCAEAILLDSDGRVAEGTGENIFVVYQGRIITPPLSNSILGGITRRSVMQLAVERGYEVVEQAVSRELLYMADELFFSGTAAEVTPIRTVDRLPVGTGKPGPITLRLQEDFFDIVKGRVDDRHRWLTPVAPAGAAVD